MRRAALAAIVLLVLLSFYGVATQPPPLQDTIEPVRIGTDPERWIRNSESAVDKLSRIVPGAEKRIRWHNPGEKQRTDWSVVYFHGYSASRQEIAPVPELVAQALGANLFESRLTGHGIEVNPLVDATAEDWLADGVEGLAIGAAIGSRTVIIGTSTGATLALALTARAEMQTVNALVLLSPNFVPMDSKSEMLTWPGGLDVARLTVGETMSWTPRNEMQARYWTTTYPMESLVEMMRLVKYLRSQLPLSIEQRLLTLYSRRDSVVNPQETMRALQQISAPQNITHEITDSADKGQHVLIGDILSPDSSAAAAKTIVEFVLGSATTLP
jgi:esterase/lipase